MNNLRKLGAAAATSAALGLVMFSAGPAAAQNAIVQGWRYNNNPAWADQQPYLGENEGGYGAPGYGRRYNNGYAYGYGNGYGYGYGYGYGDPDAGGATVAICPDGYRLGPSGRMCWPD